MTRENIGGADGGRTHDLRIAKPDKRETQVTVSLAFPCKTSLLRRADGCRRVLTEAARFPLRLLNRPSISGRANPYMQHGANRCQFGYESRS